MDTYTLKTKKFLEREYSKIKIHKPGFQKNPRSIGIAYYIRIYNILSTLNNLKFNSLVDIGGGYGYYPYIIKNLFAVRCRNADLSEKACALSKKLFGIESDQIDIHHLPYKDGEFDVILCSETLEHVADYKQALKELLRVAKKMVIITVPNEPKVASNYNRVNKVPHGHIHSFQSDSFDYVTSNKISVHHKPIENVLLYLPDFLLRAQKVGYYKGRYNPFVFKIYNFFIPLFSHNFFQKMIKLCFNKSVVTKLIYFDHFLNKIISLNHTHFFMIYKKPVAWRDGKILNLNCKVLDL